MGSVKAAIILLATMMIGFFAFILSLLTLVVSPIAPKLRFLSNQFFLIPFGMFVRALVGIKVVILHKQRVSENRPAVLIGNHQTALDFAVISHACPGGMIIVAKRELKFIPIFGWFFWIAGNLLIDRSNPRSAKKQLDGARTILKEKNLNLAIFPEGTRSRNQEILPFKKGAFHIAVSLGFPILPVVCSNLKGKAIWEKKELAGGYAVISVMEPISTAGVTSEQLEDLMKSIREKMIVEFDRVNALAKDYDQRKSSQKESCCN
jgi:1-acyl-sn-glycerol-3-phosphate acyltransferase